MSAIFYVSIMLLIYGAIFTLTKMLGKRKPDRIERTDRFGRPHGPGPGAYFEQLAPYFFVLGFLGILVSLIDLGLST